jgi:hypothetical protein
MACTASPRLRARFRSVVPPSGLVPRSAERYCYTRPNRQGSSCSCASLASGCADCATGPAVTLRELRSSGSLYVLAVTWFSQAYRLPGPDSQIFVRAWSARQLGDSEQALCHAGGAAGVRRESISADLVCERLRHRSTANEHLDLVAQPCFGQGFDGRGHGWHGGG